MCAASEAELAVLAADKCLLEMYCAAWIGMLAKLICYSSQHSFVYDKEKRRRKINTHINVGESSPQRGVVEVVLACCGCSKNIQYSGLANSWADTVDPNPSKRSKNLMIKSF